MSERVDEGTCCRARVRCRRLRTSELGHYGVLIGGLRSADHGTNGRHQAGPREETMNSTNRRRFLGTSCAALCAVGIAGLEPVHAQYPERGLTLIVPYGAGGGTDITARLLAKDLEPALGKPVTVENRAGGGGWVGWGALAAARPDGYTLGYLNVPSMYAGYLDVTVQPQGNAGQLHAADEPRHRLQCLGGEGGQPVQDREGRHRGGEEGARQHHGHRLWRRQRRSPRDPVDRGRDRHEVRDRPSPQHRRRQDARRSAATSRCSAPMSARSPRT